MPARMRGLSWEKMELTTTIESDDIPRIDRHTVRKIMNFAEDLRRHSLLKKELLSSVADKRGVSEDEILQSIKRLAFEAKPKSTDPKIIREIKESLPGNVWAPQMPYSASLKKYITLFSKHIIANHKIIPSWDSDYVGLFLLNNFSISVTSYHTRLIILREAMRIASREIGEEYWFGEVTEREKNLLESKAPRK